MTTEASPSWKKKIDVDRNSSYTALQMAVMKVEELDKVYTITDVVVSQITRTSCVLTMHHNGEAK